jgi:hypothetical protein
MWLNPFDLDVEQDEYERKVRSLMLEGAAHRAKAGRPNGVTQPGYSIALWHARLTTWFLKLVQRLPGHAHGANIGPGKPASHFRSR